MTIIGHRILGIAKDHLRLCCQLCLVLPAVQGRADESKVEECGAPAVGEEAEVANAHEAFRKQVQEEGGAEFIKR